MENAENYGFILRYPSNKTTETGIMYEPWHFRYVGVEHAKEINRLGLCLEEYIDYLEAQ
jgi:D-alanyl-D-alanine carboxypeptidase